VFEIHILDVDETFRCSPAETVLASMAKLGRKGIPVGCRGGGCGVCKVQIVAGDVQALAMSREHVSLADEQAGVVLACRIRPASDLSLRVIGKFEKQFKCSPHKPVCAS